MVLTQVLCRLIPGLAVACLISCRPYRVLEVEILRPAKIQVEPGKKVALLDRGIRLNDSVFIFQDEEVEAEFRKEFMRGMNKVLVDMSYDTILPVEGKERMKIYKDMKIKNLPPDSVMAWCRKFQADYLVSLEVIGYEWKEGKISCYWQTGLYKSGERWPLDTFRMYTVLPEKVSYYKDGNNWLMEDIYTANWNSGVTYARRIVPYWEKTERRMYNRGRALGLGDGFWQAGRKKEAMNIWEGLIRFSDKKALKACLNLAWSYEEAGDFDASLAYLNQAGKLVQQKKRKGMLADYLKDYLQQIEMRIKQLDALELQLNTFEP